MYLPDPSSAVKISVIIGAWCALLGFPIAVFFGWLLARRRFPGKTALATALLAPLVMPPVVTGYLLLELLGGTFVPFSLAGAVLAALIVGLPLYILSARIAIASVDEKLEEVSWTLGKGPGETFRRITLPLAFPGLAAGALLAFARGLGEFGATVVLAGNTEGKTRSIALAIYALLEAPGGEREMGRLLWASLALSFGALAGYEFLLRWQARRLEGA